MDFTQNGTWPVFYDYIFMCIIMNPMQKFLQNILNGHHFSTGWTDGREGQMYSCDTICPPFKMAETAVILYAPHLKWQRHNENTLDVEHV